MEPAPVDCFEDSERSRRSSLPILTPVVISAMSYSRPSDEDIIKYEQSILDSEVNSTPLVSDALQIIALCDGYEGSESFVDKIMVSIYVLTYIRLYQKNMTYCVNAEGTETASTELLHLDS